MRVEGKRKEKNQRRESFNHKGWALWDRLDAGEMEILYFGVGEKEGRKKR